MENIIEYIYVYILNVSTLRNSVIRAQVQALKHTLQMADLMPEKSKKNKIQLLNSSKRNDIFFTKQKNHNSNFTC